MATHLSDLIQDHILKLNPLATVFIAVFQAVSRAVVPENEGIIYVPWGAFGRVVVVAESPYEPDELGNSAPRGIRYFIATAAPDQETAMRYFVFVAGIVHTYTQLSANAAAYPLQLRLMTVWRKGLVPFRELLFEPELSHPMNCRVLDVLPTQNLWSVGWRAEEERLGRAAVQYELALRRVQQNEPPLGLAHLWMGIEAVTKALIRHECKTKNLTEADLGASLGLDPADPKFSRSIEPKVRERLIFGGDLETYKQAKAVSDGLEHGFATWEEIWSVKESVFPATARCLRTAIMRVLDVPDDLFKRLLGHPFDAIVEPGPRIAFEAKAPISQMDLRATDFRIANVRRKMTVSNFDAERAEYHYEYTLEATRNSPQSAT